MGQPKAITAGGNGGIAPNARGGAAAPTLGCDQEIERSELVVHNELTLSGWAVSPHGISGMVVQIDDRTIHATYGLETPWLAKGREDVAGADRAGYRLNLDTSGWRPGRRQVEIAAFDQAGGRAALRGEVEVLPYRAPKYDREEALAATAAGETVMWLERPSILAGSCEVAGPLEVSGWAYAEGGLDSVLVTLDGRTIPALRPIVRPDLLEEFGPEVAAGAGFALTLDPSECPPGHHRLTVVALGSDGDNVGVSGEFASVPEPSDPPLKPGEPAAVEWLGDRAAPRERREVEDRYVPGLHAGSLLEAEHQLRYRWARELAPGCEVLDAGCGFGWGTALLAEAGAERVAAIDPSEEALAEARRRASGGAVDLHLGSLSALPFDDASFDLITCFAALERSEDPELALEELRRVLRPDGVALIAARRRKMKRAPDGPDAALYTATELERALRERFPNVRLHRQHALLASALLDDEALASSGGDTNLGLDVRKLSAERPGGETHVVAVVGEGPLPDLGRIAALSSRRAIRGLLDSARTWEDRALRAEAETAATRVQLNLAEMHQRAHAQALSDREGELAELGSARRRLAEQEERLVGQEERLVGQEERLVGQEERLVGQEERIWDQHRQIERQQEQVEALDALIDSQAATLGARNAELRVATERLRRAEAETASWRESISVKITKPLRAVTGAARRARRWAFRRRG